MPESSALRTRLLLAVAAAAVLLAACSRNQPDEAQIRSLISDAVRAAEEKQVDRVVRGVSETFRSGDVDRRGVKQLVAYHVLRGSWVALTVSGDHVVVDGDSASAVVDLVMVRGGAGRTLPELLPEQASVYRFTLKLARESEGWKVTTAAWRPISLDKAAAGPRPPE